MSDIDRQRTWLPVVGADAHEHPSGHGGAGCSCDPAVDRARVADASVGRARVSDAPAVGVVQQALWIDAFADVLDPDVVAACTAQVFASAWRSSLATAPVGHRLLVARASAQVVGFAAFGPADDPDRAPGAAELLVGGVHPYARGAGHGSRLLNAVVDEAMSLGYSTLDVWVPRTTAAARTFLTAAGLADDGARRERVVADDGRALLEVRLTTSLAPFSPSAQPSRDVR